MSKMKWRGKELEKKLAKATSDGLLRAGTFYQTKCRLAVNRPNTGRRVKYRDQSNKALKKKLVADGVKRKTKGRNQRSYTIYPNPSKPGESPRLRTGFGRNNIVINHKPGRRPHARVGITKNAMYMFYLELGTRRVKRRPWLMKTLIENQEMIGKLAATGKK